MERFFQECEVDPLSNLEQSQKWISPTCKAGFQHIKTPGKPSCPISSKTGLWENVGVCKGIDECSTGTHDCHSLAVCTDTFGSFTCSCIAGFSLEGKKCNEIDECRSGTHDCHALATCTNTVGSFTCVCNKGYSGTGQLCKDADECSLGTHDCPATAICSNVVGSFTCACDLGLHENGNTCNEATKCASSCIEISALPIAYANPASAHAICQGRKTAYHQSAKLVSMGRRLCALDHFKAIGMDSDKVFWTADVAQSLTGPPKFLSSTSNWVDQSEEHLVVCEYETTKCKRTPCRQTCSDISVFPLQKTPFYLAESVCQKNLRSFGHAGSEYVFAQVASLESERNFGCVSRHLQETRMSGTLVFGGYGTAPNGTLLASNGLALHFEQEAYVVCE
eukprot:scpid69417/ scgid3660/ Fibrillin-1; MP340